MMHSDAPPPLAAMMMMVVVASMGDDTPATRDGGGAGGKGDAMAMTGTLADAKSVSCQSRLTRQCQ